MDFAFSQKQSTYHRGGIGVCKVKQVITDKFCQAELQRLGSDFPYTEMFKLAETKKVPDPA
jgi:hypothetical protein